jgi:uncharacterized protein YegL
MRRGVALLVGGLATAAMVIACGTKFEKAAAGLTGNTDGSVTCTGQTVDTLRKPVYMLIVQDASGSMTGDKWNAAQKSLQTFFADFGTHPDNRTAIGLTVFSDSADKGLATRYVSPDVPIANVDATQAALLIQRISTTPSGGTPSKMVLTGQYPVIDSYDPATQPPLLTGGKKVLIFISDGVPTDVTDPNAEIWQMVAKYHQLENVLTFSVGIGTLPGNQDYDPKFMAMIAVAGGTPKPGCDPNDNAVAANMCHFQITPGPNTNLGAAFKDAIDSIRGAVSSCTFDIDPSVGPIDPSQAQVVLRSPDAPDVFVNQDAAQGACFDHPQQATKVTLAGGPCDQVHSGKVDVKIVVGCVQDGGLNGVCGNAVDVH